MCTVSRTDIRRNRFWGGFFKPSALTRPTILGFLLLWPLLAGRAIFFPLARGGSASAILDEKAKTATLIDGGQKGSLLETPLLGGKPILSYLLDGNKYENLVIVCSHPHSDHQAGLLELVKYAGPNNISQFKTITFVDSDYPAKTSLWAEYNKVHGKRASVAHESATNRDAFAKLRQRPGTVDMKNFEYKPFAGKGPHGYSVVSEYGLLDGDRRTNVVDFDDADSAVVAEWAKAHPPKEPAVGVPHVPTIYVAPHHNSDLTDVTPLLAKGMTPDAVVFSVNPNNKFLHPGPANWKKWIDTVGLENVHITGLGKEVTIGPEGLPRLTQAELERIPEEILAPMFRRMDLEKARIRELAMTPPDFRSWAEFKKENGKTGIAKLALLAGISAEQIKTWEAEGGPIPEASLTILRAAVHGNEVKERWDDYEKTLASLKKVNTAYKGKSNLALLSLLAVLPPEVGDLRRPKGQDPRGTSDSWPPNGPDKPSPPNSESDQEPSQNRKRSPVRSDGTSNFSGLQTDLLAKEDAVEKARREEFIRSLSGGIGGRTKGGFFGSDGGFGGGVSLSRTERFRISVSGIPIFGGVVIGNRARLENDWKLIGARIRRVASDGDDPSRTDIVLELKKGDLNIQRTYSEFTEAELWSAYRVVRPLASWKKEFKVRDQDSGMVGLFARDETGWTFGINPAIANTSLASDAMQLDMTISVLNGGVPGPSSPVSAESQKLMSQIPYYYTYQWFDSPSLVKVSGNVVEVESDSAPKEDLLRIRYVVRGGWVYGTYRNWFKSPEKEVEASRQLAHNLVQEVDYVRRIDRFAKLVALLNLISDEKSVEFPDLPSDTVKPPLSVDAAMRYATVDSSLGITKQRLLSIDPDWFDKGLLWSVILLVLFLLVRRFYRRRSVKRTGPLPAH